MKHAAFPSPGPRPGTSPAPAPGPEECAAIAHLRCWLGGEARSSAAEFRHRLGPEDGAAARAAFAALVRALTADGRPFAFRAPGCTGFSRDERAFARFLATAATGDEEAATGLALHLFQRLPPRCLLGSAARAGLALRHIAAQSGSPAPVVH